MNIPTRAGVVRTVRDVPPVDCARCGAPVWPMAKDGMGYADAGGYRICRGAAVNNLYWHAPAEDLDDPRQWITAVEAGA